MLPHTLGRRLLTYIEIIVVSLAWFAFVGWVLVVGLSYLGTRPLQEWAQKGLDWPVVITFVVVFLLPYLVIAAAVWGVNLSILGAQAEKVPAGKKAQPQAKVIL